MAGSGLPADLVEKFRTVARERVSRIVSSLESIEQRGAETAVVNGMMREIHTLKGEAAVMSEPRIAELAHRIEDLLVRSRAGGFKISDAESDRIVAGLDLVIAHLVPERAEAVLSASCTAYLSVELEPLQSRTEEATGPSVPGRTDHTRSIGRDIGEFLRISGGTVSEFTELASDVAVHHEAMTQVIQSIWDELRATTDRGPLLDSVRRLRDFAFEARLLLGRLQDAIQDSRLLAVSALFERFPPAIRNVAREHGKRVRVVVEGGAVTVDKEVLDIVDDALVHLVRNSVDHGIEPPDERKAVGKSEIGTITLAARQLGSRVEIVVRDDGRGISADVIRRVAVERGVVTQDEAQHLEDDAALRLLFRPGFSTRDAASHTSGRGVGLDVVAHQVQALGGTVELATEVGRGTKFTLLLPVSAALVDVLCFRCGQLVLGVPSVAVQRVVRPDASTFDRIADRFAMTIDDRRIPLLDLRRCFGGGDAAVSVIVVEHADIRLGLVADSLIGGRHIAQRSLGRFLAGIRLISGVGIFDRGQLVQMLNLPEIVWRWSNGDDLLQRAMPMEARRVFDRRVLIAEDSELTRDMLVGIARRAGMSVTEAVDGRDALAKVRAQPPDLILTDIDMPAMNGFELIAAVRGDPASREIPVVVLTTRGSDDDKRRALMAGADAYIVKQDFSESTLHDTLEQFVSRAR
jgi:two-component system, chemotaxis family, sensor kinase CheA